MFFPLFPLLGKVEQNPPVPLLGKVEQNLIVFGSATSVPFYFVISPF